MHNAYGVTAMAACITAAAVFPFLLVLWDTRFCAPFRYCGICPHMMPNEILFLTWHGQASRVIDTLTRAQEPQAPAAHTQHSSHYGRKHANQTTRIEHIVL